MSKKSKLFLKDSNKVAFDRLHRKKIKFNISKYEAAIAKGELRYNNIEQTRRKVASKKRNILDNLYNYLLEWENNAKNNGIEVLWAKDAKEAQEYLIKILQENNCKALVKSKSMTTEEIDFNENAQSIGVESLETDLGEYIVQLAGERPYHIVTPAMHKSKEDIAALFNEKFGIPLDSTPEQMTAFVRQKLRNNFQQADVGVTGANFLIADKGAIAVTENEGNGVMSASFPRVHIAIAGIEKLIPSYKDLGYFWPLLAAHGTGQQITVYNSMFSGPKKENEKDGPEKMYVILLDNGRSNLYNQKIQAEALSCIRCGACLNACPIYKNVGGYTYESTYSGPIGSVITPHLKGLKDYKHLSFACSLCGRCAEVCPMKIPLPKLLLQNRFDAIDQGYTSFNERMGVGAVSYVLTHRGIMNLMPGSIKNYGKMLIQHFLIGKKRSLQDISKQSFNEQWKKTMKNKN